MQDVTATCAGCSADLGKLSDPDQAEAFARHFETCKVHLKGDGLLKEKNIAWTLIEVREV